MSRTIIRPTGLAVVFAASVGLIVGTAGTAAIHAAAPHVAPTVRTVAVTDPCAGEYEAIARTILANEGMMLTAWENGSAYHPDDRAKNLDVLAYQLDQIECEG